LSFVQPMLAHPIKDAIIAPGQWVAEEKYDGHRIIAATEDRPDNLFDGTSARAWSRDGNERLLPPRVREGLKALPFGTYDGELVVPGSRSYGVTVLENSPKLVLVVFDVLRLLGADTTKLRYDERRALLEETFREAQPAGLELATQWRVDSRDQLCDVRDAVWKRGGEGLIVKHRNSLYHPGKRSREWLKVKALATATLTVVGYQARLSGPHSTVVLRDDEGYETTVKTRNRIELARLDAEPDEHLGKRLVIEFQERTPDGSYRHPRWDRWENE